MYRGDSWTHVAVGPTCLRANFRLPSTDTGDVSTCVEQNLVHLSSSSSSLVDLNPPPPSRSHPASFCHPFRLLPFSFYYEHSPKHFSAAVHLALCFPRPPITPLGIYSGANQSSCFEADPEGCGFYPWLVIVAVSSGPKWVDACHTQTLHCFKLIYITLPYVFMNKCVKFYNSVRSLHDNDKLYLWI